MTLGTAYVLAVLIYGTHSSAAKFVLMLIDIADEGSDAVCNAPLLLDVLKEKQNDVRTA
jgi:hypothetical protein